MNMTAQCLWLVMEAVRIEIQMLMEKCSTTIVVKMKLAFMISYTHMQLICEALIVFMLLTLEMSRLAIDRCTLQCLLKYLLNINLLL